MARKSMGSHPVNDKTYKRVIAETILAHGQDNMSAEDRDYVVELFVEVYDESGDGALNKQEFRALAAEFFHCAGEECDNMFHHMDQAHQEEIRKEQLLQLLDPLLKSKSRRQNMWCTLSKARKAANVHLFAEESQLESYEDLLYFQEAMKVIHIGNNFLFLASFVTAVEYSGVLGNDGVVWGGNLDFLFWVLRSMIWTTYTMIFWRFFRSDTWNNGGVRLYTAACITTAFSYQVGEIADELSIIGLLCFLVGSVPFFLRKPSSLKPAELLSLYDHSKITNRGALLFFLGSALFLKVHRFPSVVEHGHTRAFLTTCGYICFVLGSFEFAYGQLLTFRECDEQIRAERLFTVYTHSWNTDLEDAEMARYCTMRDLFLYIFFNRKKRIVQEETPAQELRQQLG